MKGRLIINSNNVRSFAAAAVTLVCVLIAAGCTTQPNQAHDPHVHGPNTHEHATVDHEDLSFGVGATGGLTSLGAPAAVATTGDLRVVEAAASLILFEAGSIEVLYMDSRRSEISQPDEGPVMLWASVNTLEADASALEDWISGATGPLTLVLGHTNDPGAYDDLRSTTPWSVTAVASSDDPPSYVGPSPQDSAADLAALRAASSGSTSDVMVGLAADLEAYEAASTIGEPLPPLPFLSQLVELPEDPVDEYLALPPFQKSVDTAPESVVETLERREALIEVIGGDGSDAIAAGIVSQAGWSRGAVTELRGVSFKVHLAADSPMWLVLYDVSNPDREPFIVSEVPFDVWGSAEAIAFRLSQDAIDDYQATGTADGHDAEFEPVSGDQLRTERARLDAMGSDSGVTVDDEPLPSELIGSDG